MTTININDDGLVEFSIDTSIYDEWVIEKVLYWLSADYIITRCNDTNSYIQNVTLEPKDGHCITDFRQLKEKLSNDFIDYKNRQTIARETANIRDLLFAKAFANSDDFVEFTFKD